MLFGLLLLGFIIEEYPHRLLVCRWLILICCSNLFMKPYFLYCSADQHLVGEAARQIALSGIPITLAPQDVADKTSLWHPMATDSNPVVLFVSDPFLKSIECMDGALEFITNPYIANKLYAVFVEDDQTETSVPRNQRFERIKYMTYWQDLFWDMRKKKAALPTDAQIDYQNKIDSVRKVSSDITGFIRHLQDADGAIFSDFQADHYRKFFQVLGGEYADHYNRFRTLSLKETPTETINEPIFTINNEPADVPREISIETEVTPTETQQLTTITEQEVHPTPTVADIVEIVHEPIAETTEEPLVSEPETPTQHPINTTTEEQVEIIVASDEVAKEIETVSDEVPAFNDLAEFEFFDEHEEVVNLDTPPATPEPTNDTTHTEPAPTEEPLVALPIEEMDDTPIMGQTYLELAQIAQRQYDYNTAESYLQKAIQANPTYAAAHLALADLYKLYLDNPIKAYDCYQQAAKLEPSYKNEPNDDFFAIPAEIPTPVLPQPDETQADEALDQPTIETPATLEHPQNLDEPTPTTNIIEVEPAETHPESGSPSTTLQLQTPPHTTDNSLNDDDTEDIIVNTPPQTNETDTTSHKPEDNTQKIVFVTGATSGIGKAVAEIFASHGYSLIINGRREDRLRLLKKELKDKYHVKVKIMAFDIRDANLVSYAFNNLKPKWRNISILINNAGLAKGLDPIHEGKLRHWEQMIDTNLKGLLYVTRAVVPGMVQRQSGHVINIGSVAGKEVYPKGNVYAATKHAVDALTKGMRLDLVAHNVKVSSVAPGHVETEFALVRFDGDKQKAMIYEDFVPLTAFDVADIVYFIASRPKHVNIQDVLVFSNQQASAVVINRSGRQQQ
jgi:NADP-dependent 3-hydroxy acid dehydrogenase YdfG